MDPFATDVLVEILRRLPANSRRLSRLVCRRWRNLVDSRTTTSLRSRAKTLLVAAAGGTALLLGDNVGRKPRMVLASAKGRTMSVIGSCNGLICLCDDSRPPGAIALANPVTGERLVLPPLPCADIIARSNPKWHRAYGFAHHQTTGKYKVVHLPCRFNRVYDFDTLQVFTLGEAAWRDVPMPKFRGVGVGARCRFDTGLVSVDGAIYWVAEGTKTIMSFDLGEERVTQVVPLPMEAMQGEAREFRLAEVRGRLGMAIFSGLLKGAAMVSKTDVWVLGSAQTWALHYTIEINRVNDWGCRLTNQLMLPHFTHGELVLCVNARDLAVYAPRTSPDGVLRTGEQDVGTVIGRECHVHQAFAHIETTEPLSICKVW